MPLILAGVIFYYINYQQFCDWPSNEVIQGEIDKMPVDFIINLNSGYIERCIH